MCGRYALSHADVVKQYFAIHGEMPKIADRYNISPTQTAPVIGVNPESGERTIVEMRWGLVPSWAKDTSIGNKMFNARSETLTEKPSFKGSVKKRRCIVPASGFYEWQKVGTEKLPHYFSLKNGDPMGFAGLWAEWRHEVERLHTFTIITTQANEAIAPIHERMPVILPTSSFSIWLDDELPPEALADVMTTVPADEIQSHRVSKEINRASSDGPHLIESEPLNSA